MSIIETKPKIKPLINLCTNENFLKFTHHRKLSQQSKKNDPSLLSFPYSNEPTLGLNKKNSLNNIKTNANENNIILKETNYLLNQKDKKITQLVKRVQELEEKIKKLEISVNLATKNNNKINNMSNLNNLNNSNIPEGKKFSRNKSLSQSSSSKKMLCLPSSNSIKLFQMKLFKHISSNKNHNGCNNKNLIKNNSFASSKKKRNQISFSNNISVSNDSNANSINNNLNNKYSNLIFNHYNTNYNTHNNSIISHKAVHSFDNNINSLMKKNQDIIENIGSYYDANNNSSQKIKKNCKLIPKLPNKKHYKIVESSMVNTKLIKNINQKNSCHFYNDNSFSNIKIKKKIVITSPNEYFETINNTGKGDTIIRNNSLDKNNSKLNINNRISNDIMQKEFDKIKNRTKSLINNLLKNNL